MLPEVETGVALRTTGVNMVRPVNARVELASPFVKQAARQLPV